jgi:APA family basic amino acid/polyamine antiporter
VLFLKKASAVAIILVLTGVHYLGIRVGSVVQNLLTGIKIAIVLGLASFGLLFAKWSGSAFVLAGGQSQGGYAFGTAMMFVMFAYSGWNASAYIAGELKEPRRTLPLSLLTGTGIVIVLYLAVNLFILQYVPFRQLQGMEEVVKEASVRAFGSGVGNLVGLLTGLALLSSLSAYIILGPRVYFAMAQDRLFLPLAAKLHPRYGVPGISILIQGAIAVAMVVTGTLEQITYYIGFALGVFPWLAVAGIFRARKKGVGDASAAKVFGYPVVPMFYLISSLILMSVAFAGRPFASTIALMTIALGIPCYFLWVKGTRIK